MLYRVREWCTNLLDLGFLVLILILLFLPLWYLGLQIEGASSRGDSLHESGLVGEIEENGVSAVGVNQQVHLFLPRKEALDFTIPPLCRTLKLTLGDSKRFLAPVAINLSWFSGDDSSSVKQKSIDLAPLKSFGASNWMAISASEKLNQARIRLREIWLDLEAMSFNADKISVRLDVEGVGVAAACGSAEKLLQPWSALSKYEQQQMCPDCLGVERISDVVARELIARRWRRLAPQGGSENEFEVLLLGRVDSHELVTNSVDKLFTGQPVTYRIDKVEGPLELVVKGGFSRVDYSLWSPDESSELHRVPWRSLRRSLESEEGKGEGSTHIWRATIRPRVSDLYLLVMGRGDGYVELSQPGAQKLLESSRSISPGFAPLSRGGLEYRLAAGEHSGRALRLQFLRPGDSIFGVMRYKIEAWRADQIIDDFEAVCDGQPKDGEIRSVSSSVFTKSQRYLLCEEQYLQVASGVTRLVIRGEKGALVRVQTRPSGARFVWTDGSDSGGLDWFSLKPRSGEPLPRMRVVSYQWPIKPLELEWSAPEAITPLIGRYLLHPIAYRALKDGQLYYSPMVLNARARLSTKQLAALAVDPRERTMRRSRGAIQVYDGSGVDRLTREKPVRLRPASGRVVLVSEGRRRILLARRFDGTLRDDSSGEDIFVKRTSYKGGKGSFRIIKGGGVEYLTLSFFSAQTRSRSLDQSVANFELRALSGAPIHLSLGSWSEMTQSQGAIFPNRFGMDEQVYCYSGRCQTLERIAGASVVFGEDLKAGEYRLDIDTVADYFTVSHSVGAEKNSVPRGGFLD